jgi:hypothetical protein
MRAVLVRPGIDPEKVAHFRLRPSRLGYSLERARSYQRELLRRLAIVPGVERAVIAAYRQSAAGAVTSTWRCRDRTRSESRRTKFHQDSFL